MNSKPINQPPDGREEHELKIWPEYFDDVESGKKTFEVRKMDRLFGVGDILHLREWSPIKGYSGRETRKIITYRMNGGQWGLSEGNCILGIAAPPATVIQPLGLQDVDLYKQIIKHLNSLPYAGGYPTGWEKTLSLHLTKWVNESAPPPQPLGIDVDAWIKVEDFIERINIQAQILLSQKYDNYAMGKLAGLRESIEQANKIKAGYAASPKVTNANELFRDDFQSYADRILRDKGASNKYVFDAINDTIQELSKKYSITITTYIPQSSTSEEEKDLHKANAELMSLRQSILESKLAEYFPKKEMSFHDKVVLAIAAATEPLAVKPDEENGLWVEVKEIFMKHYDAYNYPSQAIDELQSTYKISKR